MNIIRERVRERERERERKEEKKGGRKESEKGPQIYKRVREEWKSKKDL